MALAPALKLVEREPDFLKPEMLRGRGMDPCGSDHSEIGVMISSALVTNFWMREGSSLDLKIRVVQVLFLSTGGIIVVRRNCMSEELGRDGARLFV